MFGKLFNNLKSGLTKTRNALTDKINEALNLAVSIDDDLYEELEEILIMADIGMDTTMEIIEKLKDKIRKEKINDVELVRPALKSVIAEMMKAGSENENDTNAEKEVILVIGVNGVGKTTLMKEIFKNNNECIEIKLKVRKFYLQQQIHLEQVLLINLLFGVKEQKLI